MSPSVFKVPADARSPLLKGVVFMDPLFRPKRELRIPPEVNDPGMQGKFARATAAGKGFLVRRLLKTEKLQMIIQTIRDTVELVLKLYEEVPQLKVRGWKGVNTEDADLCRRLFQQLTGACASFHDVFFKLTTPQRMAIIASDREKMKAKEMKNFLSRSARPTRGPSSKPPRSGNNSNLSKRKISTATAKCLERRMSALHS
jgi:centrosomal protein CEP110